MLSLQVTWDIIKGIIVGIAIFLLMFISYNRIFVISDGFVMISIY